MSKRELIDIQTPNKDVVASFIYSWARQKDMSILEQRVVLRIIERASIKLKGIKLRDNMCKLDLGLKNVTITMPASAVLFNTKMKHKDIEQALYNLRGRTFEYKDNERYTVCGFINNATYVYGTGEITVEVDNKIWRVLTDFSEGFRRFELNKALALPTSYSLQFYMVLSGQERPFKLSIDDLKSWLGIAPDKYRKDGKDRVDHIEDRILRPVKKLLDENCPYTFTYDKIRANQVLSGLSRQVSGPRTGTDQTYCIDFGRLYGSKGNRLHEEADGIPAEKHSAAQRSHQQCGQVTARLHRDAGRHSRQKTQGGWLVYGHWMGDSGYQRRGEGS